MPRQLLESLYDKIVGNEIKMESNKDQCLLLQKKKVGVQNKEAEETWKKRWLVLKDNCLYYFKSADDKNPCGIIPLENLKVKESDNKSKSNVFEVYSPDGEIKSCKLESGQLVKGHHGSYQIAVKTKEDMDAWIQAIRQNIAFNPLFELIKTKRDQSGHTKNSKTNTLRKPAEGQISFAQLLDYAQKCANCYKGSNTVKDIYGADVYYSEDNVRHLKSVVLLNPSTKTQTVVLCGFGEEGLLNKQSKIHSRFSSQI